MKRKLLPLLSLFSLALCLFGNPSAGPEKKKPGFPSGEEILKKFDADGDGQLSEEERKKVREEMASRRSGLPPLLAKQFDKDGDGKLSEEERDAFRKEMAIKGRKLPPHLMQRFDKDGDGTLSEEERAGARQAWEDRKKTMLEKFDADGDGTLNVEERREAIKQTKLNPLGGSDKQEPEEDLQSKKEASKPAPKKEGKGKKKSSGQDEKKKQSGKGEKKAGKKKDS